MEAETVFNKELCEFRHQEIEKEQTAMENRLKTVEGRFLTIMTSVVLILIVAIINLLLIISKGGTT